MIGRVTDKDRRRRTVWRNDENMHDKPVLAVGCTCGWLHMTAYRGLRARWRSRRYLRRRFDDHACREVVT